MLHKCRGDLLEIKEGKLKTQPSLLENLVFFVEVKLFSTPPHTVFFFISNAFWIWHKRFDWVILQTVSIVLWTASYCAKTLRPLKTSLQKKKKKKKDANAALVHSLVHSLLFYTFMHPFVGLSNVATLSYCPPVLQPLVVCQFQELTGNLQDLLTQALEHIREKESGITAQKLANLTLEGCSQVSVKVIYTRFDSK